MKPTKDQVDELCRFLKLMHGPKLEELRENGKLFATHLHSLNGFIIKDAGLPERHVGSVIVDAVLQVGHNWEKQVKNAVNCIKTFPQAATVSGFIRLLDEQPLNELARFQSERIKHDLLRVARFFASKGIDTFEQLYDWLRPEKHRDELLTLERDPRRAVFSAGDKTADYFRGVVGHWDAVAVDRNIRALLDDAGIVSRSSNKYGYKEKRSIVQLAALDLGCRPIDLDSSIYKEILYYARKAKVAYATRKRLVNISGSIETRI